MRRIATLLPLLLLAGTAEADAPQWRPDGSTDGVQVERRDVPGSHFDELRLSLVSPLSLDRLCAAIYPKVLNNAPEPRFKKRVLLKETESERWTYEQISVPVVSDRDYVMHVKLNTPASTGRCDVTFETVTDASRPPVPGFVRIPVIRGHWDLVPSTDGRVIVRYEIFSEPGGAIPAFLARGSQKRAAIDFMKIILSRASVPAARLAERTRPGYPSDCHEPGQPGRQLLGAGAANAEIALRRRLGVPDDAAHVLVFSESSHWDTNWLETSEEYFESVCGPSSGHHGSARERPLRIYCIESVFFLKLFWERHPGAPREASWRSSRPASSGSSPRRSPRPDTLLPHPEAILRDFHLGQVGSGATVSPSFLGRHTSPTTSDTRPTSPRSCARWASTRSR